MNGKMGDNMEKVNTLTKMAKRKRVFGKMVKELTGLKMILEMLF